MSAKSPAFQFYPADFLGGRVAAYDLDAIGAYLLLLSFDWNMGGLPIAAGDAAAIGEVCPKLSRNSVQTLAKLCRTSSRTFERIWATIHVHFVASSDGTLRNPRLQREREKQLAYSERMSENGKLGGRPRKPQESRGKADVKPSESSLSLSSISTTTTPPIPPSSPDPVPSREGSAGAGAPRDGERRESVPAKPVAPGPSARQRSSRNRHALPPYDQIFEEAWAAYPSRPGNNKAEAWGQWLTRVREGVDPLDMLEGTRRYARYIADRDLVDRHLVLMARTFYGPSKRFADNWQAVTAFSGPMLVGGWLSPELDRATRPAVA